MDNDFVSIVMPSYNTAQFIAESIQSVILQTHTNWELIIVDDCSTDNTDEIVAQFTDSRIRYYKNEHNCGAALSRNKALCEARGKWIAFLDSDDLWTRDKLEKQIKFMKENEYAFTYTKYCEINEHSEQNGVHISGPKRIGKCGMYNYCWPGCLTVMYNSDIIGLVQIEDIKKNNDYAMWLKVCQKSTCYLLDEELGMYRKGRSGSISTHSYKSLIKWHYRLFKVAEKQSTVVACINTFRNLVFGFYKKKRYVRKV